MTDQTQGSLVALGDSLLDDIESRFAAFGRVKTDEHRWIISTHECCFAGKGETLEVMRVTFQDRKPPGAEFSGHSARRLAAEWNGRFIGVESDDRVVIPLSRDQRAGVARESCLTGTSLTVFKSWLGNRYSRPALPDKVSGFMSNRKISAKIAALLDDVGDVQQILIRGHEDADDPCNSQTVTGIRLVVLLKPGAEQSPEAAVRRRTWCEQIEGLRWTDEDTETVGVALDGVACVHVESISAAEYLAYDRLDLDYVSNRQMLAEPDRDAAP